VRALRKAVRWAAVACVPGEIVLVLCVAGGVRVPPAFVAALELAVGAFVAAAAVVLRLDYRRHLRDGGDGYGDGHGHGHGDRRAAFAAALADTVPAPVLRLTVHEFTLFTSTLRWLLRRGPHGVRPGEVPVPYASGQTAIMCGFLFVCVVETVALALLIPWPLVDAVFLVLDVWGCYFVVALHLSCVVRPHVIGADGSLRLRYGALLDVRIPADRIASVRADRRFPEGKLGAGDDNGTADLAVASQTTVTVELTEPVRYVRVLGRRAEARAFRFYAADPAAAAKLIDSRRSGPTSVRG
jgi:hypothetical protein